MKWVATFPGQGSQKPAMGKEWHGSFREVRDIFEEADDVLSRKCSEFLLQERDEIVLTKNAQPALYILGMAIFRVMQTQMPDWELTGAGGLSLGEWTAVAATDRLSFAEGLRWVDRRAQLMTQACAEKPGSMWAVLGMNAEDVIAALAGIDGIAVANCNAPGQVVIAGTMEGFERAKIALPAARRLVPLAVEGAFHTVHMESARLGMAEMPQLQESSIPMALNVTGGLERDAEKIRLALLDQITRPVLWESNMRALQGIGNTIFELGCGRVLAGLGKRIECTITPIDHPKVLDDLTRGVMNA